MRGARTLQSTVRMPASARTASNVDVKFEPRSRIKWISDVRDTELRGLASFAKVSNKTSTPSPRPGQPLELRTVEGPSTTSK